ncbi:MAG: Fe-S cluster assembly protein SufD [Bacteroidota bacterium]
MENISSLKKQLLVDFQQFEIGLNGNAVKPIHQIRKTAFDTFQQLNFPTIRHEEWKYSNVKSITEKSFNFSGKTDFSVEDLEQMPIPNLEGNIIYFINGIYSSALSKIVSDQSELIILPISEAIIKYSALITEYFNTNTDSDINAFSALNTAFTQHGLFVYVPDNKVVAQPVILRFITDARAENIGLQPRNLFIIGKNAELQIAESYRTLGENEVFTNAYSEIFVNEEANVHYYKVQNETDSSYHIGTTAVLQKSKSVFTANTVTANGGFVRNNLNIKVDGEYAEANMFGLYIPNNTQHIDNHTVVDHMKPNSNSNEFYKGVLKDKSTGVFNGKIFVRQDAQKTNAFQSCKNVLASTDATMNTKPQLEIWADDVKCSHGTTTGQLNDDALFYMQARGISKATAKSLLMLAFAQEVIDKMEIESIKVYLQGLIQEKIYNS